MSLSPRPAAAWKTSGGKVLVTSAGVAALVRRPAAAANPLAASGRQPGRLRPPTRAVPARSEIVLRSSR